MKLLTILKVQIDQSQTVKTVDKVLFLFSLLASDWWQVVFILFYLFISIRTIGVKAMTSEQNVETVTWFKKNELSSPSHSDWKQSPQKLSMAWYRNLGRKLTKIDLITKILALRPREVRGSRPGRSVGRTGCHFPPVLLSATLSVGSGHCRPQLHGSTSTSSCRDFQC